MTGVWRALLALAEQQGEHQFAADPTDRFRALLVAAMASGVAHVAGPDGGKPLQPEAWGWRKSDGLDPVWQPRGTQLGWVEHDNLYIDREAAFGVVQRLARDVGDALPVSARTLTKRLHERGLLKTVDQRGGKVRPLVRRHLQGLRRDVLHFDAAWPSSSDLSGPSGPPGAATSGTPPGGRADTVLPGDTKSSPNVGVAQRVAPRVSQNDLDNCASGPLWTPVPTQRGVQRSRFTERYETDEREGMALDGAPRSTHATYDTAEDYEQITNIIREAHSLGAGSSSLAVRSSSSAIAPNISALRARLAEKREEPREDLKPQPCGSGGTLLVSRSRHRLLLACRARGRDEGPRIAGRRADGRAAP